MTEVASTALGAGAAISATLLVVMPVTAPVTVPLAGGLDVASTVTGAVATVIECADGGQSFDCAAGIAGTAIPLVSGPLVKQSVEAWGPLAGRQLNAVFANLDNALNGAAKTRELRKGC